MFYVMHRVCLQQCKVLLLCYQTVSLQNRNFRTEMIPVVDCRNNILGASNQILHAIETVGFVYLKNFGISSSEVKI